MASITFTAPGGVDPVRSIINLRTALQATAGDGLFGGQLARTFIRQRTARGVGIDGNTLASYSDSYAKQKQKRGRNSSPVDLFGYQSHPHMLNAILVRSGSIEIEGEASADVNYATEPITDFRVGIYASDLADRMRFNNEGTRRLPRREVFGVSSQERDQIEQRIGQRMLTRAKAGQ